MTDKSFKKMTKTIPTWNFLAVLWFVKASLRDMYEVL